METEGGMKKMAPVRRTYSLDFPIRVSSCLDINKTVVSMTSHIERFCYHDNKHGPVKVTLQLYNMPPFAIFNQQMFKSMNLSCCLHL